MKTNFKTFRKIDVYQKRYTSTKYKHGYGKFVLEYRFSTGAYRTCAEAAQYGDACSSYLFDHVANFSKVK